MGRNTGFAVLVAVAVLLCGGVASAEGPSPDGTLKSGTLKRGPDGRLYLSPAEAAVPAPSSAPPSPPPSPTPSASPSQPIRSARIPAAPRTITVCGSGCDLSTIGAALRVAHNGDTVLLKRGVYTDGGVLVAAGVTIRGEAGAHLKGGLAEGKAALVIRGGGAVVDGLECSGITAPDHNGACIRQEGRDLTVRNAYFHDAEEGILTGAHLGTLTVENSRFERLGAIGRSHAIYVGDTDALVIRHSTILSSRDEGHEVKSRAARTLIEDSVLASLDGTDSRALDVPNGGELVIRDTVLEKGVNAANAQLIGYGLEGITHTANTITLEGVTAVLDRQGAVFFAGPVRPAFRNTRVIGGDRIEEAGLSWFADRAAAGIGPYPELNIHRKTPRIAPPKPTSRHVCGSGGCDYNSVAAALREAASGSVIVIAPGDYAEAGILRANDVTLKAEQGARLVGAAAEGKAALVVKGNGAVIEGLDCSGISVPDGNGACIRLEGRNLTLRHVHFHDSQEGLLAADDTGDIVIEDSRFERLGNNGRAHAIYVNKANSLVLRRSILVETRGRGHAVKSRAATTAVENSTIATGLGQDSRLIDIPNGGRLLVKDSILEKGPASDNDECIGFGLEGLSWPISELSIRDTTIIMDRTPNAIVRTVASGEIRGGRVIGAGPADAVRRGIGRLVNLVKPNRAGDNLTVGEDVQLIADRPEAGFPPFPALPSR